MSAKRREEADCRRSRVAGMSTDLIRRDTIEELCAHRQHALDLFAQAFDTIVQAGLSVAKAAPTGRFSVPRDYRDRFVADVSRETWVVEYRKAIDRAVWLHLLSVTELERLMDKEARDTFRNQLEKDPPEATADNCFATIMMQLGSADQTFRRGIANVFSSLDRRFRSHDGFKIGSKIILRSAFSEHGGWNHYARHDETLRDIERTFLTLDGKPHPEYVGSFSYNVSEAYRLTAPILGRGAGEFADDYFRIVWFKNGNAHLWFKRDDLLVRVNQLLAEYYGAALGSSQTREDFAPNRTPARNDGFFETPRVIVQRMLEDVGAQWWVADAPPNVLEPSAGLGSIALAASDAGAKVTAIEMHSARAAALARSLGRPVLTADFFDADPHSIGLFDYVLMNPPFDGQRDIDHVTHAWRFVKPGGTLVAIMSAGVEFSETKRAIRFREMVASCGGTFVDLPPGSFKESGTMVNTVMLRVDKRSAGT